MENKRKYDANLASSCLATETLVRIRLKVAGVACLEVALRKARESLRLRRARVVESLQKHSRSLSVFVPMRLEIEEHGLPANIECMRGESFRVLETSGIGCACAIHAAFGTTEHGFLRAAAPRDFLRACFGDSADEFLVRLNDESLATRLRDFLWKAVLKPYVCAMEPSLPCNEELGPEERQIANRIATDSPTVIERSRDAVLHAQDMIARFAKKRAELVAAFSSTCIEPLRDNFIVPLLTSINVLDEYVYTAWEPYGTKLDALFGRGPESRHLQQGVLEYHGIEQLVVFRAQVQGILENWEDFTHLEAIGNFSAKLEETVQAFYVDPGEPFPNFFAAVYPSYVQVMANDNGQYFLSDMELLALCRLQRRNIALAKLDEESRTLKYHAHSISDPNAPIMWISIQVRSNAVHIRSHFERLEHTRNQRDRKVVNEPSNSLPSALESCSTSAGSHDAYAELSCGDGQVPSASSKIRRPSESELSCRAVETGATSSNSQLFMSGIASRKDPSVAKKGNDSNSASDNDEESSSNGDLREEECESSDEEDVFHVAAAQPNCLSRDYRNSPNERWRLAVEEAKDLCRSDCTIPLDPFDSSQSRVFPNLEEAYRLPLWHCPFRGCRACDCSDASNASHEQLWWNHIKTDHSAVLSKIIQKHKLQRGHVDATETMFALIIAGMLEREREFIPKCGVALDRRSLAHVGEVFYESNIKTLMCFICGCKHCYHMGYDKYGTSCCKGTINFRSHTDPRFHAVLYGSTKGDVRDAWEYNLSYKRFRTEFGAAVATDPDLNDASWEWRRRLLGGSSEDILLCNPEDVVTTKKCNHDNCTVCQFCQIPICNECWKLAARFEKIPKALANDNYNGYIHRYFVEHNVTWLEATIACPVFSGLVTYYIEGPGSERHHLMEEALAHPSHAYGVRGNIFSFLLPWEKIQEAVRSVIEGGNLQEWPLAPSQVQHLVRVRLVRGPESLLNKFKELAVRARVLRDVARIYIENHMIQVEHLAGVMQIHAKEQEATVRESLLSHARKRIESLYPEAEYGGEGGIIPELIAMLDIEHPGSAATRDVESGFEMKQSTMSDALLPAEEVFQTVRPNLVMPEASANGVLADDVLTEFTLGKLANMEIKMGQQFEEQFISKYLPSIFPFVLNYKCGGPEYPDLFGDWSQDGAVPHKRWRREKDEAVLSPGKHAQMLATRVEAQIAGDWMLVPAARTLHWRYTVLRNSFLTCKRKVYAAETVMEDLSKLINAAGSIFRRLLKSTVVVDGVSRPLRNDVSLIYRADDVTPEEQAVLRGTLNATKNVSGCQALRKRIGHILFGFRVIYGELLFWTISPNRKHSTMILKLSRVRENDAYLARQNPIATARKKYAGCDSPPIFTDSYLGAADADTFVSELAMPAISTRLGMNAQDPLSATHYFDFCIYVLLPAAFGLRMCFQCPHCNWDLSEPGKDVYDSSSCQDLLGKSTKPMGGILGLGEAMACGKELQGDGTVHAHGFVAPANVYQHATIEDIGKLLVSRIHNLTEEEIVDRITGFVEHLHKEEHFFHEEHQENLKSLEKEFHNNNAGPPMNAFLSVRPRFAYEG